jgi:hypothetical protein
MGRPSQKATQTGDDEHAGRLWAVHRDHEETPQGKTAKKTRFPRRLGFLVRPLTRCELGIGQTLPGDLRHDLNEAASIVAVVAMIKSEDLFRNVSI